MKKNLAALAGAMLLTSLLTAHAQGQRATIWGNYDCGRWFTAPGANTWLLGYLSGVSAMSPAYFGDPLKSLDSAEQAYLWMDNYCEKNPLSRIDKGAAALINELRAKK